MDHHMRIVIADDHPGIRLGVRMQLSESPSFQIVGEAGNSDELVALLDRHECDVLVLDLVMPGGSHGDGLGLVRYLRTRHPRLCIIPLSSIAVPAVSRSLIELGIRQIVSKSDDLRLLGPAVFAAKNGKTYWSPVIAEQLKLQRVGEPVALTDREVLVLKLFASGLTVNEIAAELNRSKQAISTQKRSAMRKLGFTADAEVFKYAKDVGLVRPE